MALTQENDVAFVYKIDSATPTTFREPLMAWFRKSQRDLPWRTKMRDPYAVWVSEIMLQQTRVEQMLPFYRRFLDAYPTVCALASAGLDDALLLWEGLGYYSRCRNLHKAAQIVCEDYAGVLPNTANELLDLPGIGPYTAAAIASTAYDEVRPAIDGNVKRVLSRVFTIDDSVNSSAGLRKIEEAASALIDPISPGAFNESMMELGATVCLPRNPLCNDCPVNHVCVAYNNGTQQDYPKRTPRKKVPIHEIAVAIVFDSAGRFYIQRRPTNGMLGGLWEFPGGKREDGESLHETCLRELKEETGFDATIYATLDIVRHAYSHFKIVVTPFVCRLVSNGKLLASVDAKDTEPVTAVDSRWITMDETRGFAFPRANRKIFTLLEHYLSSSI